MYILQSLTNGSGYAEESVYSQYTHTMDDDSSHIANPFALILKGKDHNI